MSIIKRSTMIFALSLLAIFLPSAQAQTLSIEVTKDKDRAQFAILGQAQEIHLEVFAPSGEMVFESSVLSGSSVEWMMQNEKGEPVSEGTYLATISVKESSRRIRKRIEQIIVRRESQEDNASARVPNTAEATITGGGGRREDYEIYRLFDDWQLRHDREFRQNRNRNQSHGGTSY